MSETVFILGCIIVFLGLIALCVLTLMCAVWLAERWDDRSDAELRQRLADERHSRAVLRPRSGWLSPSPRAVPFPNNGRRPS